MSGAGGSGARPEAARRLTVVKIGGRLLGTRPGDEFFDQVASLWEDGADLLVVHGGGDELTSWLRRLGIATRFVQGQRVTSPQALEVALMVLGGLVNRRIVEELLRRGCPAVGLTGADGGGSLAAPEEDRLLGAVGRIVSVNAPFYLGLVAARRLPVLASLGWDADHGWLNVNADLMAASLAAGLGARRLLLVTDVPGVRSADGTLRRDLTLQEARALLASGEASAGMIPKLMACRIACRARVPEVRILGSGGGALRAALSGGPCEGTRIWRRTPPAPDAPVGLALAADRGAAARRAQQGAR